MSINSLNWVINHTKVKGNARLVLLSICDHASGDFGVCFASIETIADDSECSPRTVFRAIKTLLEGNENGPWIERIGVSEYETVIYRPVYERTHDKVPSNGVVNVSKLVKRGGDKLSGGADLSPKELFKRSKSLKELEAGKEAKAESEDARAKFEAEFEESFWPMYPPHGSQNRKLNKKQSLKKFLAARGRADLQTILDGLSAWVVFWSASGTEPKFIPHATTWLEGDRWEAAPEPPRPAGGVAADDSLREQMKEWAKA